MSGGEASLTHRLREPLPNFGNHIFGHPMRIFYGGLMGALWGLPPEGGTTPPSRALFIV